MEYIIDGYNLIKSSFLKKYESGTENNAVLALLHLISGYRRKHPSVLFTVVFDGFIDIRFPDKNIRILFSHERTADELIRYELERNTRNNRIKTVVSDDREVQICGKILGSRTLSNLEFLQIVCPSPSKTIEGKNKGKSTTDINTLQIENELKNFYEKGAGNND